METQLSFDALNSANLTATERTLRGLDNTIRFEFPNFRVRSPSNGFPDLGRIEIEYTADRFVIDPSSLDDYIAAYRQVSAFGEDIVNRMFEDLLAVCSPFRLTVRITTVSEGDIDLEVEISTDDNPR